MIRAFLARFGATQQADVPKQAAELVNIRNQYTARAFGYGASDFTS
jgi:hypothetical protein